MSETDTGSAIPPAGEGAYAPTPSSQNTDQEQSSSFPKEEASKLQGSNTGLHPLEGDPVKKADEFEQQRKNDLDAEREEHLRRRSGGEAQE